MIFAYRQTAITNRALTMEVHLAQLPTVFSRLFRNVFFPLFDKVLERTMEAITASLAPRVLEAGKQLLKAKEQVDQVRGKIVQGLAALETLPGQLPDAGFDIGRPKDSVNKLKKDWNPIIKNAKDAWNNAELETTQDLPAEGDALEQAFPVQQRIKAIEAMAVTPRHLRLVQPELKWKVEKKQLPTGSEAGAGGATKPSDTDNSIPKATLPGGPSKQVPSMSEPAYPYGDYPLASEDVMYAAASQQGVPGDYEYGGAGSYGQHGGYPPPSSSLQAYAGEYNGSFSDPPTADIPPDSYGLAHVPAPSPSSSEKTTEFGVSPDLRELAQLEDVEMTMDIDHAASSALPPFLGPSKKA